ncbi:MAG: aldehyde dehydrogenase [Deltaproteobacteria bacterium]|nr:aldehyde dehydrogenase [Deltaproteobacteria bacterium]
MTAKYLSVAEYNLLPNVKEYLSKELKNCIGGKWQSAVSGETFEKKDPATNEVVAHASKSGIADVDMAVTAARRAFDNSPWKKITGAERQDILLRFADLIDKNREELCQIECLDLGRPATDPGHCMMGINFAKYYAGLATKISGETLTPMTLLPHVDQVFSYTLRQPVGVVAAVIPWNAPMPMFVSKVAPAIATGCTMVIKPASDTPLIAGRLMELLQEAGVPDGVVNLIQGPGGVAGSRLVSDPRINKITFTGSTEVGKSIAKAAMENLTRISLELGGKSPSIIFDDADMKSAPFEASLCVFMNCGQICVAGSRLFIQKKRFDEVVSAIQHRAETMKIGPGMDPENEMGPLINASQKAKVLQYMQKGIDSGARLVTGGKGIDRPGNFVKPTIFVDVDKKAAIYREEIFGPVLIATPFNDLEDLITEANDTNYGLAANIWTKDLNNAIKTAAAVNAGMITINGATLPPDPNLPFGGFKQSGIGRENGKSAIDYHTEVKTVSIVM